MNMLWIAILLGVVEGLTEFLPISSTGHLIIVSSLVGFHGKRAEVFQIFIQLGAILSVVWEYRARLFRVVVDLPTSATARIGFNMILDLRCGRGPFASALRVAPAAKGFHWNGHQCRR